MFCLIPVSAPERGQSEMPNVTFYSEVPAARVPRFGDMPSIDIMLICVKVPPSVVQDPS